MGGSPAPDARNVGERQTQGVQVVVMRDVVFVRMVGQIVGVVC